MRSRAVAIIVAVAVVLAGGGGFLWWRAWQAAEDAKTAAATALVDSLATAWGRRDVSGIAFADASVPTAFTPTFAGLGKSTVAVQPGSVVRTADTATATLQVAWTLAPSTTWQYTVPVLLAYTANRWTVRAPESGSFWVPKLPANGTVTMKRTAGVRGNLLDAAGKPLMPMGDVYPVQLDPARANAATARGLEQVTGETGLVAKLAAAQKAGSKAPIPVITYRQSDFDARRQRLDALTGVIYPRTQQPLAPTRTFGQPLLGSYGYVTAEMVKQGNGRYAAGDRAGLSGLQGAYNSVLDGNPGVQVVSNTGAVLFEQAPTNGSDVSTTLDVATQKAAESAVAKTGTVPSALVAVDVTSGHVLAVANNPTFGFDRALTGQYPPGSTMKIATTYALLTAGQVTPSTQVSCPSTVVVDGRTFRNFEGETLGRPTFDLDFAHSCNTAFIHEAAKLPDDGVAKAATALGIGRDWAKTFGVAGTYADSVPTANGATDKVAGAIGQGRDLASPAAMATLVASIARGSYLPSQLVFSAGGIPTSSPGSLNAKAVGQIRTMMGMVVTQGTAKVMQGTPGGTVYGKTGTAEYGNAKPPKNRVWFVGWQGKVAFAVMVEDGSAGGAVAAPIAKAFLTALHNG